MSFPEPIPIESLHSVARTLSFGCAQTPARQPPTQIAEPIKVALRVRKFTSDEQKTNEDNCININKARGFATVKPRTLALQNEAIRKAGKATFQFGQIFDEDATQEFVFKETAYDKVEGLFEGKDGLIFAYGTTNAGKTYTIKGTGEKPGLLPRSLDMVFNSIRKAKGGEEDFMSKRPRISEKVRAVILDLNPEADIEEEVTGLRATDDAFVDICSEKDYSVIVSYLEIYNEQCFDLLDCPKNKTERIREKEMEEFKAVKNDENVENSANMKAEVKEENPIITDIKAIDLTRRINRQRQPRRKVLKIRERTSTGEIFVEDLKEIEVDSVRDVELLLAYGQRNRRTEETNANRQSSRSHTIFTITLKQRTRNGKEERVIKSSLSIVDLAGSERTSRTNNSGQRLREAAKINTSLMNLGRCLEILRRNQQVPQDGQGNALGANRYKKKQIVPFRQSRLTRLFQRRLENGSAVMLVNASPVLRDADETIHALRCAAVAREVQVGGGRENGTTMRTRLDGRRVPTNGRYGSKNRGLDTVEYTELAAGKGQLLEKLKASEKEVLFLREELDDSEIARKELLKEVDELHEALSVAETSVTEFQEALCVAEGRVKVREIELRRELTAEFQKILKMKPPVRESEDNLKSPIRTKRKSSATRTEEYLDAISKTVRKNMTGRKMTGRRFVRKSFANIAADYKELYEQEKEAREFENDRLRQEIERRDELLKELKDDSDTSVVTGEEI